MYQNEYDSLEKLNLLVEIEPALLIYFYSDNCAPCLSLRPKVVELIRELYPELKLVFVNAENQPEIAGSFNVFSFPTLILYFARKEHNRSSKYVAIPQLSEIIKRPYTMLFND